RVALNEVADGEDEFRLEQVDLLDGPGEDLLAVPAGAVADDDELEVLGVVVESQVRPGVALLGLDLQWIGEGRAGLRGGLRESHGDDQHAAGDKGVKKLLHWCEYWLGKLWTRLTRTMIGRQGSSQEIHWSRMPDGPFEADPAWPALIVASARPARIDG